MTEETASSYASSRPFPLVPSMFSQSIPIPTSLSAPLECIGDAGHCDPVAAQPGATSDRRIYGPAVSRRSTRTNELLDAAVTPFEPTPSTCAPRTVHRWGGNGGGVYDKRRPCTSADDHAAAVRAPIHAPAYGSASHTVLISSADLVVRSWLRAKHLTQGTRRSTRPVRAAPRCTRRNTGAWERPGSILRHTASTVCEVVMPFKQV